MIKIGNVMIVVVKDNRIGIRGNYQCMRFGKGEGDVNVAICYRSQEIEIELRIGMKIEIEKE